MLSVHGLVVRLGGLSILRSLSLEIPTGAILGLVGRNGAGKTTTLRSIMGLVPVESGHVVLDNRDIVRLPPFERGRLAGETGGLVRVTRKPQ